MKWCNKGHELDEYAKKLTQNYNGKIYIFGAGLIGEELRNIFEKQGCFNGYIDNDRKKQESGVNKANVISLQEYLNSSERGIIVIAADAKNIPSMERQLEQAGLCRNRDYYEYKDFMEDIFPILLVYAHNKLYVELAQICLTERCSLKCKKCAHGCYAVDPQSLDMDIDMAKKSADSFFEHVDIVKEFVLIGENLFYTEILMRLWNISVENIGIR